MARPQRALAPWLPPSTADPLFLPPMFPRKLPRIGRPLASRGVSVRQSRSSPRAILHQRKAHSGTIISDPAPGGSAGAPTISLAHPKDPANTSTPGPTPSSLSQDPSSSQLPSPSPSSASSSPPLQNDGDAGSSSSSGVPALATGQPLPPLHTNFPSPHSPISAIPPAYINPPFNTHHFYSVLEMTMPPPIAHNLMNATRALLVDRLGRVKREALTSKDLEVVRLPVAESTHP